MSTPSTRITTALAEIKALCQKATPGPWRKPDEYDDGHDIHAGPVDAPIKVAGNYDYEEGGICTVEDRDFIAASRETIERLVSALEFAVIICENVDAIYRTESLKAIADKLTGGKP